MKLPRVSCFIALLLPVAWAGSAIAESESPPEGFVSLFDGKSLEGWEGNTEIFRVREGAIVGGTLDAPIKHNEFLCTTREFGDFELRLQAKLLGRGQNAGIQFRSKRVANHHEVSGYQADMGIFGSKRENIWGALYDESRRNKFLAIPDQDAIKNVFRDQDWNDITIRCEGARVQIWVNGLQTVDYTEADSEIARTGVIGLQIHGGLPAEAQYRNIYVREF